MANAPEILITAGAVGMIASVVGGGLRAFGAEVPIVSSMKRQAALFAIGAAFLAAGLYLNSSEAGVVTATTMEKAIRAEIPSCQEQQVYVAQCDVTPREAGFFVATTTATWIETFTDPETGERPSALLTVKVFPGADPENQAKAKQCGSWPIALREPQDSQTRSCSVFLQANEPVVVRVYETNRMARSDKISLGLKRRD